MGDQDLVCPGVTPSLPESMMTTTATPPGDHHGPVLIGPRISILSWGWIDGWCSGIPLLTVLVWSIVHRCQAPEIENEFEGIAPHSGGRDLDHRWSRAWSSPPSRGSRFTGSTWTR